MTTPLDELAEQIGAAVMDAIENNRRINKGDLVDAAHTVLRRRRSLLGMEAPGSADRYLNTDYPEVWITPKQFQIAR